MVISVRQSFPQKRIGGVLYPVRRQRFTVPAVSAPVVASLGTQSNGSPGVPAGVVAGSRLVMFTEAVWNDGALHNSSELTVPGFSLAGNVQLGLLFSSYAVALGVWYKDATGSDSGAYSVSGGTIANQAIAARVTGGPAPGNPFVDAIRTASGTGSNTIGVSSFTPGGDNALLLAFTYFTEGGGGGSITPPAGWTSRYNAISSDSDYLSIATLAQASAVATGALSWTNSDTGAGTSGGGAAVLIGTIRP